MKMSYNARKNLTNILRLLSVEEGSIVLDEIKKSSKFNHKLINIEVSTSTINGVEARSIIMDFRHIFNYVLVEIEFPSGGVSYVNY